MVSGELVRDPWPMTNLTTGEATHVDPTHLSVLNHLDFLCRVASGDAHFYVLITSAGFETFFPATGTVLDQSFDGELPVPGPVPPEKIGELQAVLTPLGVTVTGPPPFDPS
jgi:hypothetical protein